MSAPEAEGKTEQEEEHQWVILACIPHVVPEDEHDITLLRAYPPQSCRLIVPRRIAPDPKDIENHPYVAAVGTHGHFLLCATQGQGSQPAEPHVLDGFHSEPLRAHDSYPKAYFLCDLGTRAATRLPDPDSPILHPGNVGLLVLKGGRIAPVVSVVVELQHTVGNDHAALLCYLSLTNRWFVRPANYPPAHRPWGGHGVIFDEPDLIWVDLSYGLLLLTCYESLLSNPAPRLLFIPLPDGCELPAGTEDLDKKRCVGWSGERLRYVQIHLRDGEPIVSRWTLVDGDTGSWLHDGDIPFMVIWADEGCTAMKLRPEEIPAVACIDPGGHGESVWFFQRSRLFRVNMATGKVMRSIFFKMNNPPSRYHSSRFIRLWMLTKELYDGAVDDMQENDSDVGSDQKSRDAKNRHVFKALQYGAYEYRYGDKWTCLFCDKRLAKDFTSMVQHAEDTGRVSNRAPHIVAKHAVFGVFLRKLEALEVDVDAEPSKKKARRGRKKKGRK